MAARVQSTWTNSNPQSRKHCSSRGGTTSTTSATPTSSTPTAQKRTPTTARANLNDATTTDQGNDNAAALTDPTDPNDLATTAQENPNDLATTSKGNNNETKTTYKGNNNENVPIKNIKYKKEKKGEKKESFTPPTLDEIRDLVKQENLSVNPEKFFYHYESRIWEGVDDWQARLRLWAVENAENAEKSTANTTNGGKLLTYAEVCALVQSGKATFDDYINIPKPDGKGFMYQHKIP